MTTKFQHRNSIPLPRFPKAAPVSATLVAQEWIDKFATVVGGGDVSLLHTVVHEESWWRDALALSWDYRTIHGLSPLISFLQNRLSDIGFCSFKLREQGSFTPNHVTITEDITWIESVFSFETAVGRGDGLVRLTPDTEGNWKAYTVYTAIQELKGHEWATGRNRPHGGNNRLEGGIVKGNWLERKQREREFLDEEPTCLIIGAGAYLSS
jgi:hypothetical protein